MPDCLVEPKGYTAVHLTHRRTVKMPSEREEAECAVPELSGHSDKITLNRGGKVKEESDWPRNEDSPLCALATAAASRTSSPSFAVKEEAMVSPEAAHQNRATHTEKREKRSPPRSHNYPVAASSPKHREKIDTAAAATFSGHENGADRIISRVSDDINSPRKHTSQLHLMEAMMQRQQQLYEEFGQSNNWMKIQRSDSNCLSKSKAKRYRWCVQKEQSKEDSPAPSASLCANDSHVSPHKKKAPMKRPGNMNSVHIGQDKLFGSVFTGASKLRCRDCRKSFATLVDLTVHMSRTGHYRDQNIDEIDQAVKGSNEAHGQPNKRSTVETNEKEPTGKVLKCLGCGHLFESLQDLTVHMIKTKHYEDVPSPRLYSQKNDHYPSPNRIFQPPTEAKTSSAAPPLVSNGPATAYSVRSSAEAYKYLSNGHEQAGLNLLGSGGPMPPAFGNQQHNFSNMLSMAALRLLGFPPYFMQMPFPTAASRYEMASAAYAAAAARMFLSSPWLTQMPSIGAGTVFPPYLNPPATTLPSVMIPSSMQQYSGSGDFPLRSSPVRQTSPAVSRPRAHNHLVEADAHRNTACRVLRCVQCGETFASLQKMTDHMRETTHFPIAMTPPTDETNLRRSSVCSSGSEPIFRASPQSKQSLEHPPNDTPTSSPLEQLAKLASGKSLSDVACLPNSLDNDSVRHSSFLISKSSPATQRPPRNHSHSSEGYYVRPSSPPKSASNSPSGFDFIKSLESTIQSAISRVSQPSRSALQGTRVQPPCGEQNRDLRSRKHRILDSLLSATPARSHRKSVPTNCNGNALQRSASDGEEYNRSENSLATEATQPQRPSSGKQLSISPPLDVIKPIYCSPSKAPTLPSVGDDTEHKDEAWADAADRRHAVQCGRTQALSATLEQRDQNHTQEKEKTREKREKNHEEITKSPPAKKRSCETGDFRVASLPPQKSRKHDKAAAHDRKPRQSLSNPLNEMQKIVNATEMTVKEGRTAYSSFTAGQKRKIGSESTTESHVVKSSKPDSVLSDLVRPDDDNSLPTANPLAQMENLVNQKIGRNDHLHNISKARNFGSPSKSYFPLMPDSPHNGASPMSALLNLFTRNGRNQTLPNSRVKMADQPKSSRTKSKNPTNGEISRQRGSSDTDRLEVKMVELFRSMIAQNQSLPDKESDCFSGRTCSLPSKKSISDDSPDAMLLLSQEMRLQAFFASHFEENSKLCNISDTELEPLSKETSLSTAAIKEWISNAEDQLRDRGRCDFLYLPTEAGSLPSFQCTWCVAESTRGLSAQDFLHHLSTHIDYSSNFSKVQTGQKSTRRNNDRETLYHGSLHFKSLKADDTSLEDFALTAHVAEKAHRNGYSASPATDTDVVEDGPIEVSG